MKKFSMIFALLFTCSLYAHADCNRDVSQMEDKISMFKSITTKDGMYRFTEIGSDFSIGNNFCTVSAVSFFGYAIDGSGVHSYDKSCSKIRWEMGDWGNTFTCA